MQRVSVSASWRNGSFERSDRLFLFLSTLLLSQFKFIFCCFVLITVRVREPLHCSTWYSKTLKSAQTNTAYWIWTWAIYSPFHILWVCFHETHFFLSFHLLGLPSHQSPRDFLTKIVCASCVYLSCMPIRRNRVYFITVAILGGLCYLRSSLLMYSSLAFRSVICVRSGK
jgi:hypothetical protein